MRGGRHSQGWRHGLQYFARQLTGYSERLLPLDFLLRLGPPVWQYRMSLFFSENFRALRRAGSVRPGASAAGP